MCRIIPIYQFTILPYVKGTVHKEGEKVPISIKTSYFSKLIGPGPSTKNGCERPESADADSLFDH